LWSDGSPVTARDFVYSWRRFVAPATAAPMASYLAPVAGAEAIMKGSKPPDSLAVRAVDDFTFQFDLAAPAPFFLKLLWQPILAAVPRQAIEAARRRGSPSSWTEAGHYVSSGPFVLREWKPYDRIVLNRNSRYWEAESVAMEEVVFLPISNGTTNLNLYRAGGMQSMDPRLIPPTLIPALAGKKDFVTAPALRTFWFLLNLHTPPLDHPAVRYALNMATDKSAVVKFLGAGQKPANGVVPPLDGYPPLTSLPVSIQGRSLNILGFNPRVARELLRAEGINDLTLSMTIPTLPNIREVALIVQRQWRDYAGVQIALSEEGVPEWFERLAEKRYAHVTQDSWTARCADPTEYLGYFGHHWSAWIDPAFDREYARGNAIIDPAARMRALSDCEAKLIRAMPVIPIFHDSWTYLEAPYLRGLKPNPFAAPQFKYAWIDTNWRPS
jgi:ABC-type oligopeptide transport system substrate-binding subunit